jgi:hypothetical protein
MTMIKKMVLSAIEETAGTSPSDMLKKAKSAPPARVTRIYAADYMPAVDELMAKGYSTRAAVKLLVEMGCPFSESTLSQHWWQRRKKS